MFHCRRKKKNTQYQCVSKNPTRADSILFWYISRWCRSKKRKKEKTLSHMKLWWWWLFSLAPAEWWLIFLVYHISVYIPSVQFNETNKNEGRKKNKGARNRRLTSLVTCISRAKCNWQLNTFEKRMNRYSRWDGPITCWW